MSSSLGNFAGMQENPEVPPGRSGWFAGFSLVGDILNILLCPGGFLEQQIPPGEVES